MNTKLKWLRFHVRHSLWRLRWWRPIRKSRVFRHHPRMRVRYVARKTGASIGDVCTAMNLAGWDVAGCGEEIQTLEISEETKELFRHYDEVQQEMARLGAGTLRKREG